LHVEAKAATTISQSRAEYEKEVYRLRNKLQALEDYVGHVHATFRGVPGLQQVFKFDFLNLILIYISD